MKHFTISELIRSKTAIEKRIWNGANREQEDNLNALVSAVLDPVRERYGKSVHVSSGFRCPQINGGLPNSSKRSQHMTGEAADIYTDAGPKGNFELGQLIVKLGNFDQGEWVKTLASSEPVSFNFLSMHEHVGSWSDIASDLTGVWKPSGYSVPEPSSGLLMLIGGALLALRRRKGA